jgi:uncharacterized protein YqjF (DUF2071 family)
MAMMTPTDLQRQAVRARPGGRTPLMHQRWTSLLFLHWEIDPALIQATLPSGLFVDTWQQRAFLGLVPFYMQDIRPHCCPSLPGISNFLEMNLRTYVYDEHGNPGVWFYSLDADQSLAVWGAKKFFWLPYFRATMSAPKGKETIDYQCHRLGTDKKFATRIRYRGGAALGTAVFGSFEFFLIERYVLFSFDSRRQKLFAGRVHHHPYELREATVDCFDTNPLELAGFAKPESTPVHTVFSDGVSVEAFALQEIRHIEKA